MADPARPDSSYKIFDPDLSLPGTSHLAGERSFSHKKASIWKVLNDYVKQFIDLLSDSDKFISTNVEIKPPKRYVTPYGGRLVWW